MEKDKKQSSILKFLLKTFKSKTIRCLTVVIVLMLATLGVFLLDKSNGFRKEHLSFLDSNIVLNFLDLFGIERVNLLRSSWILFLVIVAYVIFLTIASLIKDNAISRSKNPKKINIIFYVTIALVFVFFAFLSYTLGAFDSIGESLSLLTNTLFMVLVCFLFILIIPVSIVLIYFLLKFLVFVGAIIFINLKKFAEQVSLQFKHSMVETGEVTEKDFDESAAEKVFPALVKIDVLGEEPKTVNTAITLEELALQFQSFAANEHKIYYGLPLIRSFFAGLGTSRLIILEGLSGTGKSMLPRMFSEFTGAKAFFAPVQATWRDKTDVLGFYSEFAKTFKTTQFLENLYRASYTDKANLMVLDEMNLSRVEYYFADFLSVMEYPPEDWKIRVLEVQTGQTLPEKLKGGSVTVPTNTWFIGTANTDDSTFTITDKVYDRAVVIDFEEKTTPITSEYKKNAISISADRLCELFKEAQNDQEKRLSKEETEKFLIICDFMKEAFNVSFGNRIMTQIESFVPIYVALGGTKEEALDFLFARKILRKVEGMFEDFVKEELANLSNLITKTYGKGIFKETEKLIAKFTKRLV